MASLASTSAVAAEIAAEQAVAVLKRAETVDARCKFLTPELHDELSDYTARAELAAAIQVSAKAARNAVAQGKAQAGKAQCDEAPAADISATLFAAREAVSTTGTAKPVKVAAANPPENRAADAKTTDSKTADTKTADTKTADANAMKAKDTKAKASRSKQAKAIPPQDRTRTVESPPRKGRGSLSRYAKLVGSYYIERKCRHLSPGQDFRYWKSIGRIHRATVAASGPAAVSAVLRQAERDASEVPCGYRSLYLVKSGFAKTVRR